MEAALPAQAKEEKPIAKVRIIASFGVHEKEGSTTRSSVVPATARLVEVSGVRKADVSIEQAEEGAVPIVVNLHNRRGEVRIRFRLRSDSMERDRFQARRFDVRAQIQVSPQEMNEHE